MLHQENFECLNVPFISPNPNLMESECKLSGLRCEMSRTLFQRAKGTVPELLSVSEGAIIQPLII